MHHVCVYECMHTTHRHALALTCLVLSLIVDIQRTHITPLKPLWIILYELNQWSVIHPCLSLTCFSLQFSLLVPPNVAVFFCDLVRLGQPSLGPHNSQGQSRYDGCGLGPMHSLCVCGGLIHISATGRGREHSRERGREGGQRYKPDQPFSSFRS